VQKTSGAKLRKAVSRQRRSGKQRKDAGILQSTEEAAPETREELAPLNWKFAIPNRETVTHECLKKIACRDFLVTFGFKHTKKENADLVRCAFG
jgi:hypothetical protein